MAVYVTIRLTYRQAEAIEEALNFRLAGPIEDTDIPAAVYDRAWRAVASAMTAAESAE